MSSFNRMLIWRKKENHENITHNNMWIMSFYNIQWTFVISTSLMSTIRLCRHHSTGPAEFTIYSIRPNAVYVDIFISTFRLSRHILESPWVNFHRKSHSISRHLEKMHCFQRYELSAWRFFHELLKSLHGCWCKRLNRHFSLRNFRTLVIWCIRPRVRPSFILNLLTWGFKYKEA